ncbi:hypothetical protein Droror1_Dr00013971 [Drosera rotundifolia]
MDSLPNAMVELILSYVTHAKDLVLCSSVSDRFKAAMRYNPRLYFPRGIFDHLSGRAEESDRIIEKMIASVDRLEELVVYCPFTVTGLAAWLSIAGWSIRHLDLRIDNLSTGEVLHELSNQKLECINSVIDLESLKLWGVSMEQSLKWGVFQKLRSLQIVGLNAEDVALRDALKACPNLIRLKLLNCLGVTAIRVELEHLEELNLDFCGPANCSVLIDCPKLITLALQGFGWIMVRETKLLKSIAIMHNFDKVHMIKFGKLGALQSLTLRGSQFQWDAISRLLQLATEVKHLFMKVEFTGDTEKLQPFPEVELVDFFNRHPKLQKFDIHGAMFAALCHTNSLRNADSDFSIPCLEEVVITVRSPLNAEQKMITIESLLKYSRNLKKMTIRMLQMRTSHSSADDFYAELLAVARMNPNIVRIE